MGINGVIGAKEIEGMFHSIGFTSQTETLQGKVLRGMAHELQSRLPWFVVTCKLTIDELKLPRLSSFLSFLSASLHHFSYVCQTDIVSVCSFSSHFLPTKSSVTKNNNNNASFVISFVQPISLGKKRSWKSYLIFCFPWCCMLAWYIDKVTMDLCSPAIASPIRFFYPRFSQCHLWPRWQTSPVERCSLMQSPEKRRRFLDVTVSVRESVGPFVRLSLPSFRAFSLAAEESFDD